MKVWDWMLTPKDRRVAVSDPLGFTAQGLEIIQIDEDKKEFGLSAWPELVAQYIRLVLL